MGLLGLTVLPGSKWGLRRSGVPSCQKEHEKAQARQHYLIKVGCAKTSVRRSFKKNENPRYLSLRGRKDLAGVEAARAYSAAFMAYQTRRRMERFADIRM